MKKVKTMKLIWLILGIFSAVSIVAGTPLLALTALKAQYVFMGILIAVVAHGFLCITLYFIQYSRERTTERILSIITVSGRVHYPDIAAQVGMTEDGARFIVERAFKKGYIRRK